MLMQIEMTKTEFIKYAAIAGVALGFLLGLIPLIVGIRKKKSKLGVIGFVSSIIVGAISGILSIIVAVVFTWLILKKDTTADVRDFSENTIDVKTDRSENL